MRVALERASVRECHPSETGVILREGRFTVAVILVALIVGGTTGCASRQRNDSEHAATQPPGSRLIGLRFAARLAADTLCFGPACGNVTRALATCTS